MNLLYCLYSILCYDIWFYASHVLLHTWFYKKIHAIHHAKVVPYFYDTYIGHILEGPLQSLGTFVPCLWLDYSLYELVVVILFLNLRGMMRHDPRCVWLIGNHHLLHHKYPQYNYGEYWLDWLMGTLYPCKAEHIHGLIYTWPRPVNMVFSKLSIM